MLQLRGKSIKDFLGNLRNSPMTICSIPVLEQSSWRDFLRENSPAFAHHTSNNCFKAVIARYEERPEELEDFNQSDWMNLCEPYNYQLWDRWQEDRDDILLMFEEFKFACGYDSTLEALENSLIEDPEDMAIAITNCAMTYAAQVIWNILEE